MIDSGVVTTSSVIIDGQRVHVTMDLLNLVTVDLLNLVMQIIWQGQVLCSPIITTQPMDYPKTELNTSVYGKLSVVHNYLSPLSTRWGHPDPNTEVSITLTLQQVLLRTLYNSAI